MWGGFGLSSGDLFLCGECGEAARECARPTFLPHLVSFPFEAVEVAVFVDWNFG